MAASERLIKFGFLSEIEMLDAIDVGELAPYNICYTSDTKCIYIVDKNSKPIRLKSKVSIYDSIESANEFINSDKSSYLGEIVSIRDNNNFIAYTICQNDDGTLYVRPICEDLDLDYNKLSHTPIQNVEGTSQNPVRIDNLPSGIYRVYGSYINPIGIIGESNEDIFFIDDDNIMQINALNIIKYSGSIATSYITESILESKGYATENYVDTAIEALDTIIDKKIEKYINDHLEYLVKHVVDEELDDRLTETYIIYGGSAEEVFA